jgi:hypothetical protein
MYVAPFYFSQDLSRRKIFYKINLHETFENHMYVFVLKLNLDFEVLIPDVCRFE